ncbi:hypothetical protein TTHERM_00151400 (macronuclear) [Tetrahymena thermophila SB210]|uniref:Cyclic nucleotide-binding domain protein n=1 Tax=Tetrahymena thermophila (strain SB210) TaxID=312017 RepID=I7M2W5_TETTS|nr:hypothetical protein TTHERM_00151400 [Tetrahymena thermophila SB210]EAS01430.2 hypothetical protein TTHERM_00151400 [Tetrahymena thermophila SB210]|eukprot:XP_001021676.2 hypothetical protein TTHERM_00151400 [Tetrahymena thermophila SB210]
MKSTDIQFTNKHLLKQFLKCQNYFQELEEDYDISSILNQLANDLIIKQYSKNTFLFHYDAKESNDWYIILKGKVSIYIPKMNQEIIQEMNLLKQKQALETELQDLELQPSTKENREKIRQAQFKKQEVEDAISKISSIKYDHIFQKFSSSYYQQHPQILSFKFLKYAGDGEVFDKKFYEKPASVFIEEDSIIGYIKNDLYQKIFQGTQKNRQIITQALKKIQQKQDSIYYMKQVKEQSPNNSPIRSQIKSQSQERLNKQSVGSCENFGMYIENLSQQKEAQQSKEYSSGQFNSSRKARTRSNFEIFLQKEVKELIRKQSTHYSDQKNTTNSNQQKNKLVTQSNASSPTQQKDQQTNNSLFVSKNKIQRGSFIELINNQKLLINQQQLFIQQKDKIQGEKSIPINHQVQLQVGANQQKHELQNLKNKTEVSPQKQACQNEYEQYKSQSYKKQLDFLIQNQIQSQQQNFHEQQSPIIQFKDSHDSTNSNKLISQQHTQFSNQLSSERQFKNDTDPVRSSFLPTSSESFDDHYDLRILSEGSKRIQKQSNLLAIEEGKKKLYQHSNKIDIFTFNIDSFRDQIAQQNSEEKKIVKTSLNNDSDFSKLQKQDVNLQPGFNLFKNQKIQQSQNQQIQTLSDLKHTLTKIDHVDQNLKQNQGLNNNSINISQQKLNRNIQKNEFQINQQYIKSIQSLQEIQTANYVQSGKNTHQSNKNQLVSQSLNNSGSQNQSNNQVAFLQMGISPNLLEKSKSYAENLRKKHKKYMTRTQSQPSLIQNCSPNTSNQNSPFSMPNKMKNQQNQRLSFSQLMQKQDQNDSNLFNLESKNQNYTLFQNNQNHINSDQYLKQKNNDKHVIYSSPQQLSRIALQRCSSTLGFQSPQPYRLERPQSSGLRGKKISMNSKYSFIQAFQNNKSQIQNADQRMLTPNKSAINQNYKNQLEQEELNHYTNEQMVLSISKDGSLQVGPISNSQQTQNFNESVSNSQKLIMIGQQNQNVKNSLKQIGLELNKQVQQQKMQKIVVQQRVQSAKYSNNQMNPHQLATQSQIQKELLKNKTQISKIVKGSIVSKLTSVQQNLLNSLQNQNQQNSERKSLGNQLQENSIRKEILTNLQRKVDTRQNSLIKLQQCNKDQIQQQNVNQQIQDYQNEDQSESKFTDKLIISEQQKQSQDFKIKLQKPVQVNSVMQTTSTIKSCLKQGNKSNKNNIQDQIEQEESIDQCKDEYYLLKLIQQREYDSPENYIGFEPEPEEQAQEESKHENDEFTLPNFGMYKSSSFHLNQSSNSQTNSQIECQSSKDVNQLENKTTNEIFKHKKMIYNTDGGSRRKSKLINKQIQEQFNNAECYDQEQITLGQNSNEDLFNVSTVQQNELQCDLQRVKIHRNNEVELNTQTFQKRRSSQGQKLVNILETPKFTFQKM